MLFGHKMPSRNVEGLIPLICIAGVQNPSTQPTLPPTSEQTKRAFLFTSKNVLIVATEIHAAGVDFRLKPEGCLSAAQAVAGRRVSKSRTRSVLREFGISRAAKGRSRLAWRWFVATCGTFRPQKT
jgi:hypothetical protein